MSARMFAAVLPPQSVIDDLADFIQPRRDVPDSGLRWTRPDGWHLTTAFMAAVPSDRFDRLDEQLAEVATRTPAFRLRIAGTVCFPNVGRARLLALAVARGADELGALASRCRNAATRAGVEPDGARFVGHLTLARANRPIEATRWVRIVDSFVGASWDVTELALVESHLSDPGNRYEVVGRYPLGASAEHGE